MDEKNFAKKLINEYSEKEVTELDQLKKLNQKVKNPATIFAYIFGIVGSLVLGVGMSLAMDIIGKTTVFMILGIVVGIIGIVMVSINYALYLKILNARKNKYANEIITKSNELLNK